MPAPVRAAAATVSATSADPKARKVRVESTTADARVRTMARTLPPLALPSLALRRPSAETSVSCMRERPNSQQSGDLTCTAGSGRR